MLKLCRVTKVKVLFLLLVYIFNFNLFEFPAAILEKGLLILGMAFWCTFLITFLILELVEWYSILFQSFHNLGQKKIE